MTISIGEVARRCASCAATAAVVVPASRKIEPRNVVADGLERTAADGRLGCALTLQALRDRGLGRALAVGRHCAAVHAPQASGGLEVVQIPAHGLGGDVEAAREVDDAHAPVVDDQALDELPALRCVHRRDPSLDSHTLQHIPTHNKTLIRRSIFACRHRYRRNVPDKPAAEVVIDEALVRRLLVSQATRRAAGCRDPAAREDRRGLGLRGLARGRSARGATPPSRARGAARAERAAGAARARGADRSHRSSRAGAGVRRDPGRRLSVVVVGRALDRGHAGNRRASRGPARLGGGARGSARRAARTRTGRLSGQPVPGSAAGDAVSGDRGATGAAPGRRNAGRPSSGCRGIRLGGGTRRAPWAREPVWIHGDLHPANLVAQGSRLTGIIDFGDVTAGDPAYDLAVAWLAFDEDGRERFVAATNGRYDRATWVRAHAWAAAVALMLLAHSDDEPAYAALGREAFDEVTGTQSGAS